MNIFVRLLSLYNRHSNNGKTPLEDFVTELLVGVLSTNHELQSEFYKEILEVPVKSYKIESQSTHTLKDDPNCIVDIKFEAEDIVCFLENKVEATEGFDQLFRYKKALKNINHNNSKQVYLRYCTKYEEPKSIDGIDFKQYYWQDVYNLFNKYRDNPLIEEFVIFMSMLGLAGEESNKVGSLARDLYKENGIMGWDKAIYLAKTMIEQGYEYSPSNNKRKLPK